MLGDDFIEPAKFDRLNQVLRASAVVTDEKPELVESESNEVWRLGGLFVRICYRGDTQRLSREARVAGALPKEIGYPEILGSGSIGELSWMVTKAVDAVPLSRVFSRIEAEERRRIGVQMGELLKIIHRVPVPDGIDVRAGDDISAEDRYPLPIPRARRLLREMLEAGRLDPVLAGEISTRLEECEALDPFAAPGVLVHGDFGVENLLWHEGKIVGVVDFEWARSGRGWVDVLPLLMKDVDVARGVRAAYPDPFGLPDVGRRIYLLELVDALRAAALWRHSINVDRLRRLASSNKVSLTDDARMMIS